MLLELVALSPVPPLLAAGCIGCGLLAGHIQGEADERLSSRLTLYAATFSLLLILAAIAAKSIGALPEQISFGSWIRSGSYHIGFDFTLDGLSLSVACLSALLSMMALRFSIHYLHREAGFHRFFMEMSLFVGAMLLLATAGNAALAFVGWELAGLSSYLLIAYAYDRPTAADNATRAFITNRIGDAGFILGIALAFLWVGGIGWADITGEHAPLQHWQAGVLACCFLLAAVAKSAQVPLAPWLARAMEGPTPSSALFYGAVMVHAGVYLVLRLEALFEQAPLAMALMAGLGLLTALYGFVCGLAQTDVKSALIFSTSGQVGLMFFAAGLGCWRLALCHLCAHAVFRGYQFLTAPSLMHWILDTPTRRVNRLAGHSRWLYAAALHRFWLEPLAERLLVKPVSDLAADLHAFDRQVVEPAFGLPVADMQMQARPPAAGAASDPGILRVSGIAGGLVRKLANALHWFEEKLVLQGVGQNLIGWGRRLGVRLNHVEELLNQPRYLIILILATLLVVF